MWVFILKLILTFTSVFWLIALIHLDGNLNGKSFISFLGSSFDVRGNEQLKRLKNICVFIIVSFLITILKIKSVSQAGFIMSQRRYSHSGFYHRYSQVHFISGSHIKSKGFNIYKSSTLSSETKHSQKIPFPKKVYFWAAVKKPLIIDPF